MVDRWQAYFDTDEELDFYCPECGEHGAGGDESFLSEKLVLQGEWRRRESNPRSEQNATDSEEGPDLASGNAAETASEPPHKQAEPDSLSFIDPGQLSVFDFLDGSNDA